MDNLEAEALASVSIQEKCQHQPLLQQDTLTSEWSCFCWKIDCLQCNLS